MSAHRICFVFAHPSDESLISGGSMAVYAGLGWNVKLICASGGKNFDDRNRDVETYSQSVPERELSRASTLLGINSLSFLGYKEGKIFKSPPGELEEKIYVHLREYKPNVVVTFDSRGIDNDPDHKRLSAATTFAFQKYARSLYVPSHLHRKLTGRTLPNKIKQNEVSEEDIPKLYYATFPQQVVTYMQQQDVLPKESFGEPCKGTNENQISVNIDISSVAIKKAQALATYDSKKNQLEPFLAMDNNPLATHEYYLLRMIGINEYFMGKNDKINDAF